MEHISGTGTYDCDFCDTTLEVVCHHDFLDKAYCENCKQRFTRERTEHPEIVKEYYCDECERSHVPTIPTEDFTPDEPEMYGYDEQWVSCKCGRRIAADKLQPNKSGTVCECGRRFRLIIEEPLEDVFEVPTEQE